MKGVILTPLRRIYTPKGDVLHGMKSTDAGYAGFGEAYISIVRQGEIKGWKRHRAMTLNLICIFGAVRFVVHDGAQSVEASVDLTLSPSRPEQYGRLTVAPGLWIAFGGIGAGENLILNVADLAHDADESDNANLAAFEWPQQPQ